MFLTPGALSVICSLPFPPAIIDVYGKGIKIQFDYYHIMQDVNQHLNKIIIDYYKQLSENNLMDPYWEIRKFQFTILKNPKNYSIMDKYNLNELLQHHKNSIVPDIITFKDKIRDIFINSKTPQHAYESKL